MTKSKKDLYLIYTRVSDAKQASEGDGLESQKHRCISAVKARDGEVGGIFSDVKTGGGNYEKRNSLMAMIAKIDLNPSISYTVLFDDTKRFARDTENFLRLIRELRQRGAKIECLNFNMDDSPEGVFIMTMIAAQGALEREQNKRQVVQKQTARIEQGFWTFQAPAAYEYANSPHGGRGLFRDEPLASFVADVLTRFANGSLQTQAEVGRELEQNPLFPKDANGKVYPTRIKRLLTQPIYAGYVEMPKWGIPLCKGVHEPLIDWETYKKIQARLKKGSHAPTRKDMSDDFALRGLLECADCARPYTSCHSKSKTGKLHPYYRCYYKSCPSYGKSLPRDRVETEFRDLLALFTPSASLYAASKAMFKAAWEAREAQVKQSRQKMKLLIQSNEKQIDNVVDRLIESTTASARKRMEQKIEELEKLNFDLIEKVEKSRMPQRSFNEMFELACVFLSNPCKLWESGDLTLRRTVLKLAFTDRIVYDREKGYLNPKKSFPFKVMEGFSLNDCQMVRPTGLEPV